MKSFAVFFMLIGIIAGPVNGSNVLLNPGFEDVDASGNAVGWNMPAPTWSIDTHVAHSGHNSLQICNIDPQVYKMTIQSIKVNPGRFYKMSAWVKTENVEGAGFGATMALEWSGKSGFLGGNYGTSGLKGTNDWQLLEVTSSTIPDAATSVSFVLYLRPGNTGKAWFDDAMLVEQSRPQPLLMSYLLSPKYRGYIWPEDTTPVSIRSVIGDQLPDNITVKDLRLLINGKNAIINSRKRDNVTLVDPRTLPAGDTVYNIELVSEKTGQKIASQTVTLHKLKKGDKRPMVYIDSHNRTIVQGKPFFPIGLYTGIMGSNDANADLDFMAKGSFNCVLNYGAAYSGIENLRCYVDAVTARKMMLIVSLKDMHEGLEFCPKQVDGVTGKDAMVEHIVKEFRKHPGVLAWYVNDELTPDYVPSIEALYRQICKLDSDHPVNSILNQMNQDLNLYKNTTDIIGSDPYPIGSCGVDLVTQYVNTTNASFDNRALWMVPQAMNWSVYTEVKPPVAGPTYDEMRNMTFQCLVGGAMGLVYYSFDDLKRDPQGFDKPWADLCKVVAEVKGLSPYLLSIQECPSVKMKSPSENVLFATRSLGDKKLLMVVNISREKQTCEFVLPKKPKSIHRLDSDAVVPLSGNNITAVLAPISVHVYEWK